MALNFNKCINQYINNSTGTAIEKNGEQLNPVDKEDDVLHDDEWVLNEDYDGFFEADMMQNF